MTNSGLKPTLSLFNARITLRFLNFKIISPVQCQKENLRIAQLFESAAAKEPASYDLLASYEKILKTWKLKNNLDGVGRIHLRRLPWVLFFRTLQESDFLCNDINFVKYIFSENKLSSQSSRILSLINGFLKHYPVLNRKFWLNALKEKLEIVASPRLDSFNERISIYSLLELDGPKLFATKVFIDENFNTIVNEPWFIQSIDYSGFLQEVIVALLEKLFYQLNREEIHINKLKKVLSFLCQPNGRLKFDVLRVNVAESLLMPFQKKTPEAELKECIKNFLLNQFGNPHLRDDVWNKVSSSAKKVFMTWLTEDTLEDFFNILDMTAGDQWQYRRDFWQAILDKNLIRRAWVILGSSARKIAAKLPERSKNYGSLTGASSDQSVLLMEIGNFVVAEWSHSGKCRFWYFNANGAPEFFGQEYLSTNLRANCYADFIHSGSDRFSWQGNIAGFMKRELGVTLTRSDYAKGRY